MLLFALGLTSVFTRGAVITERANRRQEDTLAEFRHTYARDWKFLATDEKVEYLGHTYQGLALPRPVLQKLFHDNSVRWFPGLVSSGK